jgi:serine/threonine-protein kinase
MLPGCAIDLQPGINMTIQRRNETASADQATRRDLEADSNTSASASCPTEVIRSADPPPPNVSPAPPARARVVMAGTAATGNRDRTIDLDADPCATLDGDSTVAAGEQSTIEDTDPPAGFGAGHGYPNAMMKAAAFDSRASGGSSHERAVAGYQILGELGRGGMGVVYKARQRGLHRLVALKMILAANHADETQLARFHTEAEAVARLQHPNIVQIHEVGEQDGLPYFSLEFVDGEPLDKRIAGIPQAPRQAAQLIETLARAMHFAHQQGIVHRDLKPANILMTQDGIPKITDFGLAKRLEGDDSSQTKSGTILGTPSYMAPEQARGDIRMVGPLSDLYALGSILYELLTGRPPFRGANPMDTVTRVTRDDPVPPARVQPKTPLDLETICLKCLQKEPARRYADCFELAEDLRRFLTGEPILARPVGHIERLWRWCRRNPTLAAAAAAILSLLLVVSVGSTWAAIVIRAEKELAQQNELKAKASETIAQEQKAIAEKNEQKARTSEKLAEGQAELALNTLRLLISKVQSQLGKQPGAQQLKRELLETAMSGLKRVAGGDAGKLRRNMSDAYLQMGGIARELGNTADASRYWQQYYEMAESALEDDPDNERLKLEMAWACRFLGEISVELGDLRKALAYHERALALRKELAAVPLAERLRRNEKLPQEDRLTPRLNELQVSEEYTRVGLIHYYLGDSAQAEQPVLRSLALREKLVSEMAMDQVIGSMTAYAAAVPIPFGAAAGVPGLEQVSEARQNLARNDHLLGEIYFRLRNLELSRTYYQKCEDIREALLRQDENDVERRRRLGSPRPPDFRLMADLAEFHQMYGAMLFSLGAPLPEVLPHIDRSIALSRRVLEIDKAVGSRQNLARALYSRGVVAGRAGDSATAGRCFRECLEIREELTHQDASSYRKKVDLLEVLARVGAHERAAQLVEKLRLDHQKNAEFLICAARCYAQCSLAVPDKSALRRQYPEMALAALQTALEQGYKDLITLETHPDLDPVRESPAFKKLLEKVSTVPSPGSAPDANR